MTSWSTGVVASRPSTVRTRGSTAALSKRGKDSRKRELTMDGGWHGLAAIGPTFWCYDWRCGGSGYLSLLGTLESGPSSSWDY